ncbi:hypothetical protein BCR43DRAFT_484768 [Syncephalastrum racemosum]|uniref:Uncharacterized protein n=1 Tax=Syncephalastrum racemosum TaxID=13706 RepID=A0A1X2HLD5_SYNRA|nr:hypothetical protein BCR43DRAFT_484768 [Syncephalastrum racemosum]
MGVHDKNRVPSCLCACCVSVLSLDNMACQCRGQTLTTLNGGPRVTSCLKWKKPRANQSVAKNSKVNELPGPPFLFSFFFSFYLSVWSRPIISRLFAIVGYLLRLSASPPIVKHVD